MMPNLEIAPALVERCIALVREMADWRTQRLENVVAVPLDRIGNEARAIVSELPKPVDADLRLAREVWHADWASVGGPMDGNYSSIMAERIALAAIRRVRAEQQPARATTWQEEH